MRKIYDFIFSISFFKKLAGLPVLRTLLSYEIIVYVFFGAMTTLVNFVVFYISDKILGARQLISFSFFSHEFSVTLEDVSTVIAWVFAVVFAYVTNKLWVFESKERGLRTVLRELISFFGARIASFALFEWLGFMLLRNIFNATGVFSSNDISKWLAKIIVAVAVVVFNYVMSKLVVFKNKKGDLSEDES